MEEHIVSVKEKRIGNTIYIIESEISPSAKETAYDKLKRLILDSTERKTCKASTLE